VGRSPRCASCVPFRAPTVDTWYMMVLTIWGQEEGRAMLMLGNVVSWLSCGAGGACVDTWCVMLLTICPVGRGTRACAVDLLSCGVEGARGTLHAAHGAIRAFDAIPQLALTRHLTSGPSAGIALASVSSLNCTGEGWRAVNRQVLQVCPPQLRLRQSTLL